MDKNTLKLLIVDQLNSFKRRKDYIRREIPDFVFATKKIVVISGVRRCCKSTLLMQISESYRNYYYLNFDDERLLAFTAADFNDLLELFFELFGTDGVFLFDEMQNINGWEKFVSRLFGDGYKIFVTGSNAKLLSSELSTALTGRHLTFQLYPFSLKEYLQFQDFERKEYYTTKERSQLKKHFNLYLEFGGFPEVVKSRNKLELSQIYQDVLMKDLIVRFKIKESRAFREMGLYLLSNISSLISLNNIQKLLGIKSVTSVKNYFSFLEEAFLMFSVPKFDYSLKKQIVNNKKIYTIDTGLYETVSFKFSPNKGRILENIVFIELKRRNKEIFYFKERSECDFLIRCGNKIDEAIQVTDSIANPDTRNREVRGLIDAAEKYKIKKNTILTYDEADEFQINRININVEPIWNWLLR
ncbi:MAG: ATP-binding protein [bacterium]